MTTTMGIPLDLERYHQNNNSNINKQDGQGNVEGEEKIKWQGEENGAEI